MFHNDIQGLLGSSTLQPIPTVAASMMVSAIHLMKNATALKATFLLVVGIISLLSTIVTHFR